MKMHKKTFLMFLVAGILSVALSGCSGSGIRYDIDIDNHTALGKIVKNGLVIDEQEIKAMEGKKISLWGYIDYDRMSLPPNVIENQPAEWTHETNDNFWHFYMKVRQNAPSQDSVLVVVPVRDEYVQLFEKIRDTQEKGQTKLVFVTGEVKTFEIDRDKKDSTALGIVIDVTSPEDIYFRRVED